MNTVQPIRDLDKLNELADYLKNKNIRDYIMLLFGIYSGLRISDILKLRVKDVRDKQYIKMFEIKTGKEKLFCLHSVLKKELKYYLIDMGNNEYIFKSRQGKNKPISSVRAWQILSEAAHQCEIDSIGTHSMRKTWGFHTYQQTKDIATIQDILNHSDEAVTKRYLGLNQAKKDEVMKNIKLIGV